jgi:hypothetical protein
VKLLRESRPEQLASDQTIRNAQIEALKVIKDVVMFATKDKAEIGNAAEDFRHHFAKLDDEKATTFFDRARLSHRLEASSGDKVSHLIWLATLTRITRH